MTTDSGRRSHQDRPRGKPFETALSWAATAAAASAVLAWAACCVLPMSLALVGLGLGGLSLGGLSWIAGQRTWITLAALATIGAGWALTWRRARMCRADSACAAPSRLGVGLLGAATLLALLALIWRPIVEPWALALIRIAR